MNRFGWTGFELRFLFVTVWVFGVPLLFTFSLWSFNRQYAHVVRRISQIEGLKKASSAHIPLSETTFALCSSPPSYLAQVGLDVMLWRIIVQTVPPLRPKAATKPRTCSVWSCCIPSSRTSVLGRPWGCHETFNQVRAQEWPPIRIPYRTFNLEQVLTIVQGRHSEMVL